MEAATTTRRRSVSPLEGIAEFHARKAEYHRQIAIAVRNGIYSAFAKASTRSFGTGFVTVEYIATSAGMSHNSAGNKLRALEHARVVEHRRRTFSGGWRHEYRWIAGLEDTNGME